MTPRAPSSWPWSKFGLVAISLAFCFGVWGLRALFVQPLPLPGLVAADKEWNSAIHQTILQCAATPPPPELVHAWLDMNPGFTHTFLSCCGPESDADAYIANRSSDEALALFRALHPPKFQSDLFRYLYLHDNGGIYADIDSYPIAPFRAFVEPSVDLVAVVGVDATFTDHVIANGFLIATPRHPIIRRAVASMLAIGTSFRNETKPPWYHSPCSTLYRLIEDEYGSYELLDERVDVERRIQLLTEDCRGGFRKCTVAIGGRSVLYQRLNMALSRAPMP